jgi:hypothetical protein
MPRLMTFRPTRGGMRGMQLTGANGRASNL